MYLRAVSAMMKNIWPEEEQMAWFDLITVIHLFNCAIKNKLIIFM